MARARSATLVAKTTRIGTARATTQSTFRNKEPRFAMIAPDALPSAWSGPMPLLLHLQLSTKSPAERGGGARQKLK
jgi:hypothetical protein